MKPIIVPACDDAMYHADLLGGEPTLSSSHARLLLNKSPLHVWTDHPRLNPDYQPGEPSKIFDFGRAAHVMTLGQGGNFAVYPPDMLDGNGNATKKVAKEWAQTMRDAGVTPIKEEDESKVLEMGEKVADALGELQIVLDPTRSEMAVLAKVDGAACRAMIDNVPEDPAQPLYDFKTCIDASPDACSRSIMNYGYDVQAVHYLDTWKAATGEDRKFRFIFQEKSAPFEVCVMELSEDTLIMARKRITRAREIWRNCQQSDHWPGFPRGVHTVDLPDFYQSKWLERESMEADHKARTGQDILDAAARWQSPGTFAAE